jgi:uncharacterized protein (TIGR02453 family)
MQAPFLGFGPRALDWFAGLDADNSKAYFDATRGVWEADARGPLERLLDELAAEFGGAVKLFRPHRDVRFSRDKRPYKTNTYGVARPPAREAGLYVSISARGLFAGTGYWRMAPDQIARYRAAVDGSAGEDLAAAVAATEAAGVRLWGEALKGPPRGYPRDHPRARLLAMKDVLTGADLGPAETLDGRAPLDFARRVWRTSRDVVDWLEAEVGPSTVPPEVRFGDRR